MSARAPAVVFGAAALLGASLPARAYSTPRAYADAALSGGGGGRFFTGSPHDRYTCEVCHDDGVVPGLQVDGIPSEPFVPGQSYEFAVRVTAPPEVSVSAVVEVAERGGTAVGTMEVLSTEELGSDELCASGLPGAAVHNAEPGRLVAALAKCGATLLRFRWVAPEQASRDAKVYVVAVAADESDDPDGDGVSVAVFDLRASSDSFQTTEIACRVGHTPPRVPTLLLFVGLAAPRRRHERHPS
ncbi:MAG: hypothetical protein GY946_01935 [bacterium]|nr:hypothetical protein [bacterium]